MSSLKLLLHHQLSLLQRLELWRERNFLVVGELFERRVLCTDDVDLVADPHVVLVHQLDVLPLLQRVINYKFQVYSLLIHRLLVIFPFPARPSVRSA